MGCEISLDGTASKGGAGLRPGQTGNNGAFARGSNRHDPDPAAYRTFPLKERASEKGKRRNARVARGEPIWRIAPRQHLIGLGTKALGAQERTRTFTAVKPLAPEASASTNSTTWALGGLVRIGHALVK
jgi:hypothetical protein